MMQPDEFTYLGSKLLNTIILNVKDCQQFLLQQNLVEK